MKYNGTPLTLGPLSWFYNYKNDDDNDTFYLTGSRDWILR